VSWCKWEAASAAWGIGMFVNAIEKVGGFTRPIFTIMRRYGSSEVSPGAAAIFFVNDEGWAVTSGKVAKMIIDAGSIDKKYADFIARKNQVPKGTDFEEGIRQLEDFFKYDRDSIAQLKINFVDCVDVVKGVQCKIHPKIDLALIHFEGFSKLGYKSHALFAGDGAVVKPGKYLCRLGFPFPEFNNFKYDIDTDNIVWTNEGQRTMPRFPGEGMVTRLVGSPEGIVGVEMSTPGFKGQNGGPLFDQRGVIYGMHSGTSKLNLGMSIHVDTIKAFMKQEKVKYETDGPDRVSSPQIVLSESMLSRMAPSDPDDKLN